MPDTPERDGGRPETIVAFDFGLRRIGVAVGQTVTASASPAGVIGNGAGGPDFAAIARLIEEWRPARLVVGLPLNADGSASAIQQHAEVFAGDLARYGLPVDTIDERHTSRDAEAALKRARASGQRGRIRKQDVDAAAAVLIAERYLTRTT
jgi:putative Holliday junction resolvase